jgi:hypothetical protein
MTGNIIVNENQFLLRINNSPIVHTVTNLGKEGLDIQPPLAGGDQMFGPLIRSMAGCILQDDVFSIEVNGENIPSTHEHILLQSKNFSVSA